MAQTLLFDFLLLLLIVMDCVVCCRKGGKLYLLVFLSVYKSYFRLDNFSNYEKS